MKYNMITVINAIIVALMLIPSVAVAVKFKKFRNRCTNTAMNICQQMGRYGAILFMILPFGVGEFGFGHVNEFLIYLFANIILLAVYIVSWLSFMKKQTYIKAMIMAAVPAVIFLVCGVTLRHFILVFCAVIFFIGHIYVTTSNYRADKKDKKEAEAAAEEKTAETVTEEKE
ncbi:MAG: hypothetical protein E7488_07225 [Ruminococcaceae bacterium]|nr:hypothetical protein [Oscillospiraceae bacterium]